ncbi:MAG: alpha/beta hydrolase domain-containing protein [Acidimicrobiia bacterium]
MIPEIGPALSNGEKGWAFGAPTEDLAAHGYGFSEHLVTGTARSYDATPGTDLGADGRWNTLVAEKAGYRTRIQVVLPIDRSRFGGVMVMHWNNVTAGFDIGAPHPEEIFRAGYGWVGVTAQKVGIDGFPDAGNSLAAWDRERYGTLVHPGDAYSFDIFGQVARAARDGIGPFQRLDVELIVANGTSQSASRIAGYVNGVHLHDRVFDGFMPTAHWGTPARVTEQPRSTRGGMLVGDAQIRDDTGTPIFVVNSEAEVRAHFTSRQPDSDTYRFWEVAGAPHGTPSQMTVLQPAMARDGRAPDMQENLERNDVEWGFVQSAALRHLVSWVRTGTAPPRFAPIEAGGDPVDIVRNAVGNAVGGIRVPQVAVPVAAQRGLNEMGGLSVLSGHRRDFTHEELSERYADADDYLRRYDAEVERCVTEGTVLAEDADDVREIGRRLAKVAGLD